MATHSSTPAWKIPWTEEPGRLQSMGSLRVGHDWVTSLSRIGEGNGNPLQYSCLENPRESGPWWAAVYGFTQSWTRLKWISKHRLPTTQEKTLHMDITRWSTPKSDWLYTLQPKMEKLYTVNKNKTRSWLWLRSWTPYCQIHLNWRK